MKQQDIKQNTMKQFLIALTLILTLATAAHTAVQHDTDVLADGSGPIMTSPYSQQMNVPSAGT